MLAKGQSKRLPGKNKKDFLGKPMFMWNLEKCLTLFDKVFVSSDDPEILEAAWLAGAAVISRPDELCGDTPNIPVYQHALQFMGDVAGIVAVQANSPTLDINLIALSQHLMESGVDELMTCHPNRKIYGSIWAIKKGKLLKYKNAYRPKPNVLLVDNSVDIHDELDYNKAITQCQKYSSSQKSATTTQETSVSPN
jgi:CMP-N-acetylneuraminic acid synthetase